MQELGRIDGLVNSNAGIYSSIVPRPFGQIGLDEWRSLFEVNVFGVVNCCQAVVPHMKAAGGGRIVNIISGTPFKGIPFMLHPVASKGCGAGHDAVAGRELGPDGIPVSRVAPGFTFERGVLDNEVQVMKLREVSRQSPIIARDQVDDVTGAVAFFMSDASRLHHPARTLLVDGGSHFHRSAARSIQGFS